MYGDLNRTSWSPDYCRESGPRTRISGIILVMNVEKELEIVTDAIIDTFSAEDIASMLGPFSALFLPGTEAVDFESVMIDSKNFIKKCLEIPQKMFYGKLYTILNEMNVGWKEKIKLSEKLIKKIGSNKKASQQFLSWIDAITDLRKIKYYANAFRCWLVCEIESELLFKIISLLDRLTSYDLDYIASFGIDDIKTPDIRMSYLVGEHIFSQCEDNECYHLTSLGKMLKDNCLNYDDGLNGRKRVLSMNDLSQAVLFGTATEESVEKFFKNGEIIIDGGSA